MNLNIVKNLVSTKKYSIKCPHTMKPSRIVVHNTANDAPAKNEVAYMIKNNNQISFHYAVDDKEAYQGIEENRNSWHCGDGQGKGNREGIAVEICYSKSGGDKFLKAEQNAVELIVDILKRYGWGIDKVTKHQDYSKKNCPHRTLELGWTRFVNMIKTKLNDEVVKPSTPLSVGIEEMARDVIAGKYGNGEDRKRALGSNYGAVQAEVNRILTGKAPAPAKKSVDTIAREIIAGKWGNGSDRKRRIENAGYNYREVQNRVNSLLR